MKNILAWHRMEIRRRSAAPWLIVALLGACSNTPEPKTAQVAGERCKALSPELVIGSGSRLNAVAGKAGLPVRLKIYQLTNESSLLQSFFDDIWADDKSTLGETLLEQREITIYPDSTEAFTLPLNPNAHSLGAVALFQQPRGRDWLVSFDIPPPSQLSPCPTTGPTIAIWLNQMKVQDGAGRVELPPSSLAKPTAGGKNN